MAVVGAGAYVNGGFEGAGSAVGYPQNVAHRRDIRRRATFSVLYAENVARRRARALHATF